MMNIIKKILFYFKLFTSNELKKANIYGKHLGVTFGVNVRILHYPRFGSEPYLITIGNNVTITRGVCFVNHDGGAAIFRNQYPNLNVYGRITVGDNVFIGINTIILPNVKIGNNVVIGAGSLVNKSIPDNVVVAGVPARIIKSIDEYKESILKKSCIINTKDPIEKRNQIIEYLNNNEMNG